MKKLTTQEYFSIGYLYLFVLGMVSESIIYKLLGINIINFSSITDVLLSPLRMILGHTMIPLVVFGMMGLSYLYFKKVVPYFEKDKSKLQHSDPVGMLRFQAFFLFSVYLGLGIGRGGAIKENLAKGNVKANFHLIFTNGKALDVQVIGQNTSYLFYIEKGGKSVVISPLANVFSQVAIAEEEGK